MESIRRWFKFLRNTIKMRVPFFSNTHCNYIIWSFVPTLIPWRIFSLKKFKSKLKPRSKPNYIIILTEQSNNMKRQSQLQTNDVNRIPSQWAQKKSVAIIMLYHRPRKQYGQGPSRKLAWLFLSFQVAFKMASLE